MNWERKVGSNTEIHQAKAAPKPSLAEERVKLALEDGTVIEGFSFGSKRVVRGEVVFNTAMSGYVETLTDPSYCGQILVSTYPLVGNYGVPFPREKGSLSEPFESEKIQVQGLVVQNYVSDHSHRAGERSLGEWLEASGVPGFTGADTRRLTRRLREYGTMLGWLFPAEMSLKEAQDEADAVDMEQEVFRTVAPNQPIDYLGDGCRILLVDVGAKDNMVRSLLGRGASVRRVPWHHDLVDEARGVDGIVIGNGPGDPRHLTGLVEQIRTLVKTFTRPIFGICLGNQILALAAGGVTYKLPYGHRGFNLPVLDFVTRRSFITCQNLCYAVDGASLQDGWDPWFVNVNDGTNEGIRNRHKPHFGVQFHPEARPGPNDTDFLFDDFLKSVENLKQD